MGLDVEMNGKPKILAFQIHQGNVQLPSGCLEWIIHYLKDYEY